MSIHASAVVEDGARLGADVAIGAFCVVEAGAELGDGVRLHPHAIIKRGASLGDGVEVHSFAVLGGAPQHLGDRGEEARLVVGARTIIREHVTLSRGTAGGRGETRIGADCFLMAGAHAGHDCVVGDHVVFANNATLGGHVTVGSHVFLGGLCAVHQRCRVGDFAMVGGCAAVPSDVIPYGSVIGNHARLAGLNVVGLKRRGATRADVRALRAAYRALFEEDGAPFSERVEEVAERFSDSPEAMRIVDFIRADAARALCMPGR